MTSLKKTLILLLFFGFANTLLAQQKTLKESDFYGTWTAKIDGEKGRTFDIKYTFTSDKLGYSSFAYRDTVVTNVVNWRFDGVYMYEMVVINGKEQEVFGRIEWVADDQFTIQIIDNKNPNYKGVKRTFRRVPRV
jgi:hypothetical protein